MVDMCTSVSLLRKSPSSLPYEVLLQFPLSLSTLDAGILIDSIVVRYIVFLSVLLRSPVKGSEMNSNLMKSQSN